MNRHYPVVLLCKEAMEDLFVGFSNLDRDFKVLAVITRVSEKNKSVRLSRLNIRDGDFHSSFHDVKVLRYGMLDIQFPIKLLENNHPIRIGNARRCIGCIPFDGMRAPYLPDRRSVGVENWRDKDIPRGRNQRGRCHDIEEKKDCEEKRYKGVHDDDDGDNGNSEVRKDER